jgi:hypothetical protein
MIDEAPQDFIRSNGLTSHVDEKNLQLVQGKKKREIERKNQHQERWMGHVLMGSGLENVIKHYNEE